MERSERIEGETDLERTKRIKNRWEESTGFELGLIEGKYV